MTSICSFVWTLRRLYKTVFVLPCRRMKLTLRLFIMFQISISMICLYKTITYSLNKLGQSVDNSEYHEKIRNIREFTPNESIKTMKPLPLIKTMKPLPLCPEVPPGLVGKVKIDFANYEMVQVEKKYKNLQNGGRYKPKYCTARHRVAIIIPYRNRKLHLLVLMNNLHAVLQRQQLDYGIYVVEVAPMSDFNRALSLNIGFTEASRDYDYQCFIFHDVDLIPENDHNIYSCPSGPRHMSVAVDKLKYKLPYQTIFGGVAAMKKKDFVNVNGFSNKFFGWGGEDDDMYKRLKNTHLNITRYKPDIARYRMLSHKKDLSTNKDRFYLLRHTNDTWRTDGLNSLTYKLIKTDRHRLFTYILTDIDPAHPAYFTDQLKIVQESLDRMREDFKKNNKMKSKGDNSTLEIIGANSSTLDVVNTTKFMKHKKKPYQLPYSTVAKSKPKPAGSLHPIQGFITYLKMFLSDEGGIDRVPDKKLATFVRGFVNNMTEAGFSISADLKFRKNSKGRLDKTKNSGKNKYKNIDKEWPITIRTATKKKVDINMVMVAISIK
ncbi:beta-1,4-N-acetylgalactosaminyltransferase bre-4-like [Ylistrum balloti]|uniref:beta-1,4-N-acetylgalactosaminyltransferase bre-4-like n=1 Tax=Ylistrum balloti TaxID=509963 RepID=UPI0029059F3B|nr:beta-1,4-N-acetylgalactosaminyltransferase bre-4-like [Ylistrum balloti]